MEEGTITNVPIPSIMLFPPADDDDTQSHKWESNAAHPKPSFLVIPPPRDHSTNYIQYESDSDYLQVPSTALPTNEQPPQRSNAPSPDMPLVDEAWESDDALLMDRRSRNLLPGPIGIAQNKGKHAEQSPNNPNYTNVQDEPVEEEADSETTLQFKRALLKRIWEDRVIASHKEPDGRRSKRFRAAPDGATTRKLVHFIGENMVAEVAEEVRKEWRYDYTAEVEEPQVERESST